MEQVNIYCETSYKYINNKCISSFSNVVTLNNERIYGKSKCYTDTSVNRAELNGILDAVRFIAGKFTSVSIYTSSQYCIDVLKSRKKKFIKNSDIIEPFMVLSENWEVSFNFVKKTTANGFLKACVEQSKEAIKEENKDTDKYTEIKNQYNNRTNEIELITTFFKQNKYQLPKELLSLLVDISTSHKLICSCEYLHKNPSIVELFVTYIKSKMKPYII